MPPSAPPTAPRAFCFDLDETLVDCEAHHERAEDALLEALGVPRARVAHVYEDCVGARTRDLVAALREAAGSRRDLEDLLAIRHRAFREALRANPPPPLPGAREAVHAYAALGPVALVTSGHRADVHATLEVLGLAGRFHAVVTGEDVRAPKPDPEPYLTAARVLRTPPSALLAFEDSRRGTQAARAAGCRVAAVPNPRSTSPEAVAAHAHHVLRTLHDALPPEAFLQRLCF